MATTNSGIAYHGRILKADGTPLQGSSVQFQLTIRSPGNENCLLYQELQTLDMANSNGVFSITINDGSGTRADSTGIAFNNVFSNRSPFTLPAANCNATTTYTPNSSDGRTFVVAFRDETMSTFEMLPAQTIAFAPAAIQALNVAGYAPGNLLKFDDSVLTANTSPLSNTQYNNLIALINGTSTQYMKSSTTGGGSLPVVASAPTSAAAGSIWFDSTTHTIKYNDGTATQTLGTGAGSGSVTSITAGTGLTGGTITTSGTIALGTAGTAGSYYKVTTDAYGRVTAGNAALVEADIPQLTTANHVLGSAISGTIGGSTIVSTTGAITTTGVLSAGSVTTNSVGSHSVVLSNTGNTHTTTLSAPTLTSDYSLIFPDAAGSSGNMLITDGAGHLSWASAGGAPSGAAGGDLAGTYPNPTVSGLRGKTVSATLPTAAGQVLKYDGTSTYAPGFINGADIRSSLTGSAAFFPTLACTASQTLAYSSVTDTLVCATISAAGLTGILPVANGGTGTATGSISGAGALTFAAGGSNQNVTLSPSGTGNTILGGSVGIGTTSPTSPLQISSTLTQTASGYYFASANQADVAPPSASSASSYVANFSRLTTSSNNATGMNLEGIDNSVHVYGGTGAINSAVANTTVVENYTGRTIATAIGDNIRVDVSGGASAAMTYASGVSVNLTQTSGTIANAYGINIGSVQGTNRWSIYASDSGAPSYFAASVGIGTSSPASPLTVAGVVQSTTGGFKFPDGTTQTTAATGGSISGLTAGQLPKAGTATTLVDSAISESGGNVGIGTSSAAAKLEVDGGNILINSSDQSANIGIVNATSSVAKYPGIYVSNYNNGFNGEPSYSLFSYGGTQASPAAMASGKRIGKLDFFGSYNTSGSTWDIAQIDVQSAEAFSGAAGGSTLSINTVSTGTTSLAPRIFVAGSGNVGVGTTSATSPLTVAGVIQSTTGGIKFPDGTTQTTAASAGGSAAISGLTAATATNSPDSLNFAQTWNWSTATTQNPMTMTANGLTTGSLLSLTSSNTSLNSTSGLLNVANTGTSTTGTVARIQSNSTAGSGLYVLANGLIGIGTTSPSAYLEVSNGDTWANEIRITDTSTGGRKWGLQSVGSAQANAGNFQIYDQSGGGVRLAINYGGSVGIGTVAPSVSLDVGARTDAIRVPNGTAAQQPAGATGMIRYNTDTSQLQSYIGSAWVNLATSASGGGASQWTTTGSNIYYSTGNVGIGTTSPQYPLQVNGAIAASNLQPITYTSVGDFYGDWFKIAQFTTGAQYDSIGTFIDVSAGNSWMTGSAYATLYFRSKEQYVNGPYIDLFVVNANGFTQNSFAYTVDTSGSFSKTTIWGKVEQNWDTYSYQARDQQLQASNIATPPTLQFFATPVYQASAPSGAIYAYLGGFISNSNSYSSTKQISYNGNVGIGTTSPGASLDVNGGIRAGASTVVTATCNSTNEGIQRYNYSTHFMEYCNGSNWIQLIAQAAGTTVPATASGPPVGANVFTFSAVTANYTPGFGSIANTYNGNWPASGTSTPGNVNCVELDTQTATTEQIIYDLGTNRSIGHVYLTASGNYSQLMIPAVSFSTDNITYNSSLSIGTGGSATATYVATTLGSAVTARYVRLTNSASANTTNNISSFCQLAVGP